MGLRYLGNIIKPGYNPLASNITTGVNVVQYQGVFTAQQQLQAQANQQWVKDPYDYSNTLLLQADGIANGSQNNTFLDSSTNNFTITRNGNTTQGSFTPFSNQPGAWGNYFGGSSDYLLLPSNSSNFLHTGAADWTFECWFWATQTSTTATLFSTAAESAQVGIFIGLNNAVSAGINVAIYRAAGGGTTYGFRTNASVFTANTWNHVAITYNQSGNSYAIYLNGISQTLTTSGTASYSGSNATYQPAIGRFQDSSPGGYYSGYISNMRAVNGSRVYTANFTPSPIPLTAITSTAFLTCQSNRFIDNSTNAYAVTVNGTPSVQPFSPFAPQYQWTSDVIGGSEYQASGTNALTTAYNSAFSFGSGDFTIQFWAYPTAAFSANDHGLVSIGENVGTNKNLLFSGYTGSSGTAIRLALSSNGSTFDLVASQDCGTITLNAWNHYGIVRSGTTVTVYKNGTSVGSFSVSTTSLSTQTAYGVTIANYRNSGSLTSTSVPGYIAGLQILKGTAINFSSVGVPTTPPTAITNTALLCNFTNAGIYDGTMKNVLETVGNAQISTSVVKYGSGSMSFNGSNSYLILDAPSTDLFAFGSGDFTIEFWLYLNSTTGNQVIYDGRPSSAQTTQPTIYVGSGTLYYYANGANRITGSSLSTGTWYHIAVARSGTSTKMFINGTQTGSTYTDSTAYTNTTFRPWIGADSYSSGSPPTNYLNAYVDDLRITKGIARYTQNFIPPSVALPRQ